MANRRPRIDFDTRMFILPRGQTPAISLSTVNLSAVKLTLSRLTERNVIGFVRDARLGQPVETWDADKIGEQTGRVVWQGTAAVPYWQANRTAHTALPMPDALAASGPGLYALIAGAGDGTPNAQSAVQMILRTDFAPTVWRGADGLTVQVRGYTDVQPRAGATLRLLAENNEILGETTTDADGIGRFAAPLLHGEGPAAARAVEVLGGEDYTLLDLSSAAFDLSDRGVTGLPRSWPARRLCLAGPRHLPARRDRAGDGPSARQRRQARRHPGARHRQAPQRAGLPGHHARPHRRGLDPSSRSRCPSARRPAPGRSR